MYWSNWALDSFSLDIAPLVNPRTDLVDAGVYAVVMIACRLCCACRFYGIIIYAEGGVLLKCS